MAFGVYKTIFIASFLILSLSIFLKQIIKRQMKIKQKNKKNQKIYIILFLLTSPIYIYNIHK